MSPVSNSPTYRPDIDGLRALSILAVLTYHGFPSLLPGGFVGVDVFFVVSGYLITGLILSELQQNRFSFASFYARRIRRIFPALVLVLISVYVAGWSMLFADEFEQLGTHIAGAAVFGSNFVLLGEVGYFDVTSHSKPLLHLWSLAIEEQFYLFWPLLISFLWARGWRGVTPTLVLLVASLGLSIGAYSTTTAFYSPLSRFWELAAGATIVQAERFQGEVLGRVALRFSERVWLRLRNGAALLGVALICAAAYVTPAESFPGWWALIPVAGSALVIGAGPGSWINRNILSRSPLVFVGLISYPLYLWHWPLISFAWMAYARNPPDLTICVLLVVSFVLAWLTYVWVERPLRFGTSPGRVVAGLVAAVVLAGSAGLWTTYAHGIGSRRVVQVNQQLAEDLAVPTKTRMSDGSCRKFLGIDMQGEEVCLASSNQPRLLIVGDSLSMAMYSAIHAGLVREEAVLLATHSHLWARPECAKSESFDVWLQGRSPCQNVVRSSLDILARQPSIEAVVFVTTVNPFFFDREKVGAFQHAILSLRRRLVYLASGPVFPPPESCRPRKLSVFGLDFSADGSAQACQVSLAAVVKAEEPWRLHLRAMAQNYPGVYIYDSRPSFCDAELCFQSDSQGVLYWRLGHVNTRGSARILKDFMPWMRANVLPNG